VSRLARPTCKPALRLAPIYMVRAICLRNVLGVPETGSLCFAQIFGPMTRVPAASPSCSPTPTGCRYPLSGLGFTRRACSPATCADLSTFGLGAASRGSLEITNWCAHSSHSGRALQITCEGDKRSRAATRLLEARPIAHRRTCRCYASTREPVMGSKLNVMFG
jgi:hypothetical protein